MKERIINSLDDNKISIYIWDEVKNPKAIIQLVHGSCEHSLRYKEFAKKMNDNQIIVISSDHRGHGKTALLNNKPLGYFSKNNGWNIIISDLKQVNSFIKNQYMNLPIIMLGHSMGSFMARTYMIDYPNTVDAYVISGTAWHNKALLIFSKNIAHIRSKINGGKKPDNFIWKLSYKPLNKKFNSKKATGFEWLSNDSINKNEFILDPLTGQVFSSSAFKDMFSGLTYIQKKSNIKKIKKTTPILLISGKEDPVGNYGKMVLKTNKIFRQNNLNVKVNLYENQRHEILFDEKKSKVEKDIILFINGTLQNK
ncbi:alpha/beta fold hydrolase [Mesoplasma florum]|uniref:alpha/beta fold hydrolase n=1 Tax=Mesoplasma florum TaxID=2151 RepID=UPI000BE2E409|nr:alpha/beta hydrolase [Mesoplasma florum]ATI73745.1 lysophospholipase [Mesoplasma florum]AVN60783.1 lysophospholipase [Mesoplasma florum]